MWGSRSRPARHSKSGRRGILSSSPARISSRVYLERRACDDPVWSAETDEDLMRQTIDVMNRRNMYGVLSGEPGRVDEWREAAPAASSLPCISMSESTPRLPPIPSVRSSSPGRWRSWGIPVAIHLNAGGPGEPHAGYGARGAQVSALMVEEVLVRHPRLRIYLMHAGYPLLDDLHRSPAERRSRSFSLRRRLELAAFPLGSTMTGAVQRRSIRTCGRRTTGMSDRSRPTRSWRPVRRPVRGASGPPVICPGSHSTARRAWRSQSRRRPTRSATRS
jgi:hypothetical protein